MRLRLIRPTAERSGINLRRADKRSASAVTKINAISVGRDKTEARIRRKPNRHNKLILPPTPTVLFG